MSFDTTDPQDHPLMRVPLVKESETALYVRSTSDLFPFCQDMIGLPQEAFFTLSVNSKNRLIERRLITFGLLDSSLVHPREVFRYAILRNAKNIICLHNHPSGDTTPSAEDVRITRQMIDAGKIIGICVMDHVIIGDSPENKYSMRENGLCDFSC